MLKKILVFCAVLTVFVPSFASDNIVNGVVTVNMTGNTAAAAKAAALDEAREKIVFNVLSKYTDELILQEFMVKVPKSDLANLVVSTGITGEKFSDTAYSANIDMGVDLAAAKKLLDDNSINNWLLYSQREDAQKTLVFVTIDGLSDWINFNKIARNTGFEFDLSRIYDGRATVSVMSDSAPLFVSAFKTYGWRGGQSNGVYHMWK